MNLHDLAQYRPIYLAGPYSRYAAGIEQSFEDISRVAAHLICRGVMLYSPISHTHPIAMYGNLNPLDHKLWLDLDEVFAAHCKALVIAEMDGWQDSDGIKKERSWFATRPVYYLNPKTMELRK